jgi:NADH:ubiquinone oxidoreductase subunit 6 (subunit J)
MNRLGRYLAFPLLILVTGGGYLLLSGELAGATMMLVFAGAAAFFMWVLVPTFDHEGNTAPIDPDFPEPKR